MQPDVYMPFILTCVPSRSNTKINQSIVQPINPLTQRMDQWLLHSLDISTPTIPDQTSPKYIIAQRSLDAQHSTQSLVNERTGVKMRLEPPATAAVYPPVCIAEQTM